MNLVGKRINCQFISYSCTGSVCQCASESDERASSSELQSERQMGISSHPTASLTARFKLRFLSLTFFFWRVGA